MSGTKKLKEGDLVLVPEGMPYFVKKRAAPKKGSRLLAKKKKRLAVRLERVEHEGEEIFINPEEEAEIDQWERELELERGDEAEDEEEIEIEYGDEPEKEDEDSSDEDEEEDEEEPEIKGAKYEDQEELVYTKFPISKVTKEHASKFGVAIPDYEMKLLPQKVRRRIHEVEVRYPTYQYMMVGPDGELVPIAKEKARPIKLIGDDVGVGPKERFYSPTRGMMDSKQNPYNPNYPFGTYVSFSDIPSGAEDVKGVVLAFSENSIDVSVKGRMYTVDYDNPTLKVAQRPKAPRVSPKKEMKMEDYYVLAKIPESIREIVVKTYIDLMKLIRTPFKPSKKTTLIDSELLKYPPVSWDEYYAKEYQSWVYGRYSKSIKDSLDMVELNKTADQVLEYESNVDSLVSQIIDVLPDGLHYQTTINDVLDALKKQEDITIFQAHMIRYLEQEVRAGGGGRVEHTTEQISITRTEKGEIQEKYYRPGRGKAPILRKTPPRMVVPTTIETKAVSGKTLAAILRDGIESYQRTYPSDKSRTLDIVVRAAIQQKFNEYEPTVDDRLQFENENLQTLVDIHRSAEERYAAELKKAEDARKIEKEYKDLLEDYDAKIENAVRQFERVIYGTQGGTMFTYLSAVLMPYIFMDGPLASYAKFFKAKLANGDFEFDALTGANLAHYLPELGMNQDLTGEQWDEAFDILGVILKNQVDSLIDVYITISNPFSRKDYSSTRSSSGLAKSLSRLLKDPNNVCAQDTGTGFRPVVRDGKYVYVPGTRDISMERIPPGEMTICYSKGKFTCHEIKSVLRAISQDTIPINPYTSEPYPPEFIAKMKLRYGDAVNDPNLWEEPDDPEPEKISSPPKRKTSPPRPKPEEEPEKKVYVRHKPPKKAKGKIEKIGLVGTYFDILGLFESSFQVWPKDASGKLKDEPNNYEFTTELDDEDINVVVFGVDSTDVNSLDDIDFSVVPEGAFVYVLGIDAIGVKSLDRTKFTRKVKKVMPDIQHIFYVDTSSDDDLIAGLTNVAIDVEALKI